VLLIYSVVEILCTYRALYIDGYYVTLITSCNPVVTQFLILCIVANIEICINCCSILHVVVA